MKYKILVILIMTLLVFTVIPSASNISTNKQVLYPNSFFYEENNAELPVWNVGNYWTYDITLNAEIEGRFELSNVRISNLKFTVDEVQSQTYLLSLTGSISGYVTLNLDLISVSGTLEETTVQGTVIVNKSTLFIEEFENVHVGGYIKRPLTRPRFDADIIGNVTYLSDPPVKFPLNIGDRWFVDQTSILFHYFAQILGQDIESDTGIYIQGHYVECENWDVVQVNGQEYDALKIKGYLGDTNNIWFSLAAGNIIKVESENLPIFSGLGTGTLDADTELVSTNYQAPGSSPNTPNTPTGPTSLKTGQTGNYQAISIDPDGDIIRFIFDWGDGTKTTSDFHPSGQTITVSKSWNKKGNYDVKVKARDKYGKESSWSNPLSVEILNDPPLKPETPDGPTSGKIKIEHTYTTSTTDPDGHDIKYLFDWGDGATSQTEFKTSGDTASASHTWTKQGNYQIKVKAIDRYGEESEWSNPLPVTMPLDNLIVNPQPGCLYAGFTGKNGLPIFLLGDLTVYLNEEIEVTAIADTADYINFVVEKNGITVDSKQVYPENDMFYYNFGKLSIGMYTITAKAYEDNILVNSETLSKIFSLSP